MQSLPPTTRPGQTSRAPAETPWGLSLMTERARIDEARRLSLEFDLVDDNNQP